MVQLVDAVVHLVLSCYVLISVGSGFFEAAENLQNCASLENPPREYTVLNEPAFSTNFLCNLVFSLSQLAISTFFFCFSKMDHSSADRVSSCRVLHFCGSTVNTCVSFWEFDSRDLEACSSQSSPLRVELHGLQSNTRSACARGRCECWLASSS